MEGWIGREGEGEGEGVGRGYDRYNKLRYANRSCDFQNRSMGGYFFLGWVGSFL